MKKNEIKDTLKSLAGTSVGEQYPLVMELSRLIIKSYLNIVLREYGMEPCNEIINENSVKFKMVAYNNTYDFNIGYARNKLYCRLDSMTWKGSLYSRDRVVIVNMGPKSVDKAYLFFGLHDAFRRCILPNILRIDRKGYNHRVPNPITAEKIKTSEDLNRLLDGFSEFISAF